MPPLVRRILLLALATGVAFDILVPGNAPGVNAPLLVAALVGAALLVAGRDGLRRMDPADAWLAPAALVLAAMAVVRGDGWLVGVDLLLALALAAGAVAGLAGARITRGLVPQVLETAAATVAAAGVGAAAIVRVPRPDGKGGAGDRLGLWRARAGRAAPVGRGLLIALPVIAVFAALFASADAVFARLATDVLGWQPDVDLEDLAGRVIVVAVVAWVVAGLLALGAGRLPTFVAEFPAAADTDGDPGAGRPAAPPPPPGAVPHPGPVPATSGPWVAGWQPPVERPAVSLGSMEAATVLVVVDLLFAAFVALQVAYLFGGRDPMAMAGLTYAEYARRGFFELVLVAILAGLLVVTLDLAVARRSRVQLAGALVLLGLTAVVLVSALLRLRLYQSMYGWTELRLVVLVAIAWLAVALAVAAVLLLVRRTRWTLHALGIATLVAVAAMNVVGPQAFVTERNLERAIDPSLVPDGGRTGLDTGYLVTLGDEAVVPVVAAWDRLPAADRDALAPALDWRAEQLRTDPRLQGWPAWNLTRERARDALRAWEAARRAASR